VRRFRRKGFEPRTHILTTSELQCEDKTPRLSGAFLYQDGFVSAPTSFVHDHEFIFLLVLEVIGGCETAIWRLLSGKDTTCGTTSFAERLSSHTLAVLWHLGRTGDVRSSPV
jgi:hypothetical protein